MRQVGSRRARPLLKVLLLASVGTAGLGGVVSTPTNAEAQASATVRAFAVPSGPLANALNDLAEQGGLRLIYPADLVRGRPSPGLSGRYAPVEALSRLLSGSGLTYRQTGPSTFTLERAPEASGGAVRLGPVRVEGGPASGEAAGEGLNDYNIYDQAAAVSHIGVDRIDRYRGSSPADIFRGTPGVLSGEARNGAGSIDVNIRGLQGFGRVATTIDGAENAVTVYQGYQGVSNRTFVDPDFIGGIDVTRGSDAASFGNAGSVAIRTLTAGDIVDEGETWGLRVRGGFRSNTSDPEEGAVSGYRYLSGRGLAEASPTGMDRPAVLQPTSGWGSVIGAFKGDAVEFLAGYAYRQQGNYHAGVHGPVAEPVNIGDTTTSWGTIQHNTMINAGLANFRPGEEVLNTQLETESWLTKLTARLGEGHLLQLGYTGFRSEGGDRIASRLTTNTGQSLQQAQTAGTSLDTYTARYRFNPAGNDLIDLKANAYWSHLELRNPIRGGRGITPEQIGLPADFRAGSDSDLWGAEISNLSKFALDSGGLDLNYGLSYRGEDTRGGRHSDVLEGWNTPRDGLRHEVAAFAKGSYRPRDWLTVDAGLRYAYFRSKDRVDPYEPTQLTGRATPGFRNDGGGFSPSIGLTFQPAEGTQFYVRYSDTLRAPSVTETVSAFNSFVAQADVTPERSHNWEAGANFTRSGLFSGGDEAFLKLGYFNWTVDNYIARSVVTEPILTLNIHNIHRARFEGAELSSRYQIGGFLADLSANYYFDVEFCRTAETCEEKSLYGDYATNHVPPEYALDLSVSQTLLQERLTLGGRVTHTGPRAIGHGDVTAQGAGQFIALVDWDPYTLTDVFADYKINDTVTASFRVENLFDRFYMDPLGLVTQPGPGRTFSASLTTRFGGDQALPWLEPISLTGEITRDWTGPYLGFHGGAGRFETSGRVTTAGGAVSEAATREQAADMDGLSTLAGVHAGYNWQVSDRWVVGLEAGWSTTWLHDEQKTLSPDPVLAEKGYREAFNSAHVDWTAQVRARLGYAVNDRLMVYGAGGPALAREWRWRDQYVSNGADAQAPLGMETGISFTEKVTHTRKGFTAGFGAEYALSDRWSLSADYSYSRFKTKTFEFGDARAGTGKDYTVTTATQIGTEWQTFFPPGDPICDLIPEFCQPMEVPIYEYETIAHAGASDVVEGRQVSDRLELHALRIGLNFRF